MGYIWLLVAGRCGMVFGSKGVSGTRYPVYRKIRELQRKGDAFEWHQYKKIGSRDMLGYGHKIISSGAETTYTGAG